MAASVAWESGDSSSGNIAASAAAGIGGGIGGALLGFVGAPVVGIFSAIAANKKMKGKLDTSSPQTSDDESDQTRLTMKPSKEADLEYMQENTKHYTEAFIFVL